MMADKTRLNLMEALDGLQEPFCMICGRGFDMFKSHIRCAGADAVPTINYRAERERKAERIRSALEGGDA